MQTRLAVDRTTIVAVPRKGPVRVRGAKRAGYQAADLLLAMTEPGHKRQQDPRVEMPKVLIETARVVGDDDLTARDEALYRMLLAVARLQGIDRESHTVDVADMLDYLEIRSVDRLVESLDRISRTTVSYDLRQDGRRLRSTALPLIIAVTTEDLRKGTTSLEFSIPFPVRRAILDALSYAKLEINAFARFKCRYTARLYQRLALRAGYSIREPWVIEPRQLAEELGFPFDKWHYGTFLRDCLKPAMGDIDAHVRRFSVAWKEERGKGRGRPVERLVFEPTDADVMLEEAQAVRLSGLDRRYIDLPDDVHPAEMPNWRDVARAAAIVKRPPDEISEGYRKALDEAKADPSALIGGSRRTLTGGMLLATLRSEGARAALLEWLRSLKFGRTIPTKRDPWQKPACPPARKGMRDFRPLADWTIVDPVPDRDPLYDLEPEDIEPPAEFFDLKPTGDVEEDIPF